MKCSFREAVIKAGGAAGFCLVFVTRRVKLYDSKLDACIT